jgi:hypothetical protein
MAHSGLLADDIDGNSWPMEIPLYADGLNDSRPHCLSTSAEVEQLLITFPTNHDMTSVHPYVAPVNRVLLTF